ncbi:MAG: hypothetical protein RLY20_2535 [Verrucomicrobiota bacterium]|jgi:hypothetical protein
MNFDPKNRQHVLMAVTLVVVALFVGEKVLFTPLWNAWKNRSARITELKRKVHEGEVLIQRGDSLDSRWADFRKNALPSDPATAESQMSRAFERWTQSSGVSMTSYRPQWKRAGDDFMTLECRADLAGDIGEVSHFLYELENDPLGVKVDSADLATRDTDGARITLTLQVNGLQLLTKNR